MPRRFRLLLTREERALLRAAARQAGESMSAYARRAIRLQILRDLVRRERARIEEG